MAAKFLKHLGIKKTPPNPPKPDYGAPKSTSVQELLPRSPTRDSARDRSTLSLAPPYTPSEFDTSSLTDSPHHHHRTLPSGDKEHRSSFFGGARPKDSSKSTSPKGKYYTLPGDASLGGYSFSDNLESDDKGATNGHEESQDTDTPPLLLDEYSDPFDLKRQIEATPELLGEVAPTSTDDDYSVPYDVKKFSNELRMQDSDGNASPRKGPLGEDGASRFSPSRSPYSMEAHDMRPQGEYDEPWEWSVKQNMIRQQVEQSATNQNSTPLMTPKRTSAQSATGATGCANYEGAVDRHSKGAGGGTVAATGVPAEGQSKVAGEDEEDEEGYTHLKEELGAEIPPPPEPATSAQNPDVRPKDRTGNYDEPWDLKELEEKLLGLAKTSDGPGPGPKAAPSRNKGPAPPHESDTRPQEGYEKPWDWKPEERDDRPPEGYEKPWDWKPHQRDDRPPEEYEAPWDQKAKEIEIDLIKAKSAKDLVTGRDPVPNANGIMGPALGSKCEDLRPGDEYDEPWDRRLNKMNLAGGDNSNKSSPSPVLPGHVRGQGQSPKRGKDGQLIGERINPLLPLDEQGWYHGSISRQSAEGLLRVHKEGSYLVRLSESNKMDYSLSLKSAQGFMHMKITSRDGRYILGQFSQPFDNIPMMIHHYSISKLPIKGQEHMSLLHPIPHELL